MKDLEAQFWGDCSNTFAEELKQLVYLREMGFERKPTWRSQYSFDGGGRSFIDIGGGPCSVLLKFTNRKQAVVVDPGAYPPWVASRYAGAHIDLCTVRGEDALDVGGFYDVAFIYNCLQHVDDPEQIVKNARAMTRELRMFEWINVPPHDGHPHMLTETALSRWSGRQGVVKRFAGENECYGEAWILGG